MPVYVSIKCARHNFSTRHDSVATAQLINTYAQANDSTTAKPNLLNVGLRGRQVSLPATARYVMLGFI
jgi:hypothetical protein